MAHASSKLLRRSQRRKLCWLVGDAVFSLSQEANCAFVLLVTAAYWVSEAVPLGAAALVPAFLYPLFGIMKSSEVSLSFLQSFLRGCPYVVANQSNEWTRTGANYTRD